MKNITVLFILPGLFISHGGTSQTATGGCTSVTVSNIPTYPVVYFASVGYKNCNTTIGYFEGCDEGSAEGGCCRIITFGNPTTPRFWLERQTDLGCPNPASTFIRLQNFEPNLDRDYRMTFSDLVGRVVKSVPLAGNEVDISDLQAGMFILNIQREGRHVFTSKLVVNR